MAEYDGRNIMKRILISSLVLLGLAAAAEVNLFRNGDFKPVKMRNEETAPQGWWILDTDRQMRNIFNRDKKGEYISGYQCFKLSFSPGTMTIRFLEDAPAEYYKFKSEFWIYNQTSSMPELAAPEYRIRGEYKLNKGSLQLLNLKPFPAAGQWRNIDVKVSAQLYNGRRTFLLMRLLPQPGLELSLRNFRLEPVYPPSKGKFIRLPDGGKLESLTLPEKASFDLHYLAAVWQSWLWRLTGVVLPVKEGGPVQNSFVFRKADLPDGSWKIKVKSSGGELLYGEETALWPALCEYLRQLGVVYYARDCRKIPAENTNLVLPEVDRTVNQRFHYLVSRMDYGAVSWAFCRGGMDWYSLEWAPEDHIMNLLLPMDLYREKHPEYYMMQEDGSRQKALNPMLMSPCMTNPEVQKIITGNFGDLVRSAGHCSRSEFLLGDRPDFCHCPNCRKNGDSYSDVMLDMTNRAARKAAEIRPDFKVQYSAYLKTHELPKTAVKPEPNVLVAVTMPPFSNPCSVHVNCRENRKAVNNLIGWSKLTGPDRTGVSNYEEERPFHFIERLDFYNRYAKACLRLYSEDPQILYIMSRWNMGEDGKQAIREFNDAYFGNGGKYITEIQQTVEDFCKKYQHRPGEVSGGYYHIPVMTGAFDRHTILPRELFDRIYPLFDRAFAAVGEKASPERTHLLMEKFKFLRMDLAKYPYTACGNDAEIKAFAARLRAFVELSRELNQLKLPFNSGRKFKQDIFFRMPARNYMQIVAGVNLPETVKDWTLEPVLQDFMRNMESRLILKPQRIPGGTLFMPGLMRGGVGPMYYSHQCPRKLCKVIRRPSSGSGSIAMTLKLDKKPDSPLLLIAEGLDDDKPGVSTMEISVNGKVIFSGANTFSETDWTKMSFTIPADCLQAGDNRIQIRNTVPDRKNDIKDDNGLYFGPGGVQDYRWGWICFSRILVLDMAGTFRDYLSGKKSPWQKKNTCNKPEGIVEIRDQALYLQSAGAPFTGVYFIVRKEDRIALKAGETIRCTIEGNGGGGIARFGFWAYTASGNNNNSDNKHDYLYTSKGGKASFTATIPEKSVTAMIIPYITSVDKKGLSITNIYYEIIRPQPEEKSPDSSRKKN